MKLANGGPPSKADQEEGRKHSTERMMGVEQNNATGRPKPRQEKRQRARRQNRLGTVKFQSAYTPSPEILTYVPISNGGSVMESLF